MFFTFFLTSEWVLFIVSNYVWMACISYHNIVVLLPTSSHYWFIFLFSIQLQLIIYSNFILGNHWRLNLLLFLRIASHSILGQSICNDNIILLYLNVTMMLLLWLTYYCCTSPSRRFPTNVCYFWDTLVGYC